MTYPDQPDKVPVHISQIVPVHIASTAVTPEKRTIKEVIGNFNSFPLTVGANPVLVLGHTPKRCRATIFINGTGVFILAKTQSECESALANAVSEITGNVTVLYGNQFTIPFHVHVTSEMWAALYSNTSPGDATIVAPSISVIKETEQ